jgi:hypothetical protein
MKLPEAYAPWLAGEERVPSMLHAFLPAGSALPSLSAVRDRLTAAGFEVADVEAEPSAEGARWAARMTVHAGDDDVEVHVSAMPAEELNEHHFQWGGLTPAETEAAKASQWALGVALDFGDDVLGDLHLHLRLANAVAPDAVAFFDVEAAALRSAFWVREAAASGVPPSPMRLFTIHAVGDEGHQRWLHTHGLRRCGLPELEILEVPDENRGLLGHLLNVVATQLVERGIPPMGEPFEAGQGIDLAWLPWEEAVRHASRGAGGTGDDRDEFHSDPSLVLMVRRPGRLWGVRWLNPALHVPILDDNPLLYVPVMETQRMRLLARERLPLYRQLFEKYGARDDWKFLIKLGYPTDREGGAEHLWFEVHALAEGEVEATLLNEPYAVPTLRKGDRGKHDLALLTEWNVFSKMGMFDADSVPRLLAALDAGRAGLDGPSA